MVQIGKMIEEQGSNLMIEASAAMSSLSARWNCTASSDVTPPIRYRTY